MIEHFYTPLQHWIAIHTGTESGGPDKYYNFWSGFGSDLGEVVLIGGLISIVRHMNCHNRGCWRVGHPTPNGYRLCKACAAKPCNDLDLHQIHGDHR